MHFKLILYVDLSKSNVYVMYIANKILFKKNKNNYRPRNIRDLNNRLEKKIHLQIARVLSFSFSQNCAFLLKAL